MSKVEEKIAHLERAVEDLSEVIRRQDQTIDALERRVAMLMHREAERESESGQHVFTGNERPPHY